MTFKLRYGMEEQDVIRVRPPTIGEIKSDQSLRMQLGYGDNLRATVNGVEQPNDALVPEGGTVVLEVMANQKAQLNVACRIWNAVVKFIKG